MLLSFLDSRAHAPQLSMHTSSLMLAASTASTAFLMAALPFEVNGRTGKWLATAAATRGTRSFFSSTESLNDTSL